MLEAAATSFQLHLKVSQDKAARYYNASKIVSAPVVALAANSPYLFGRDLWDETRITLFEQAISVGEWDYAERVTFGIRFLDHCLSEVFVANRQRYPGLLPRLSDAPPEEMTHLKLCDAREEIFELLWRQTSHITMVNSSQVCDLVSV